VSKRLTLSGLQAAIPVIRDLLFLVGGGSGIAYQQITNHVQFELLMVYAAMLGVPGIIGLRHLGKPEALVITEPSSLSPAPLPPPQS